ncbi:cilia- and flagella-associated protein 44 [Diretmus argenteus]
MYYNYDELISRPTVTPDSDIPENLLHFSHSFGYDCGRGSNLQLLDERTLTFVAGNLLVLLDVPTRQRRHLRSCSGGGIGCVAAHPSKTHFAVAEKGERPNIIVYEFPSLRPYRVLRGGTALAYSCVGFSGDGTLLAGVGSAPDYMLTLWDWRQEEELLRGKASSQDIYRVTFSPHNPGQLTTSGSGHIKFWKMSSTFCSLTLQGLLGCFESTPMTDIEGYVELPDGKVVSGSEWGNLLLWDGDRIKVEIFRRGGRTCHAGSVLPFALEEGELLTMGSDGAIRGWDLESIATADPTDASGKFQMEPMNEMTIGRNVSLSSAVKSSLPDSSIWFAQDSNGGIWSLDLSFSNITQDPELLFSFHAGPIQGLDLSRITHLMATTAMDRSVKVYDILSKTELTTSRFEQGGTTLSWAPPPANQSGGLLATGFEDGVVRLLELFNPQRLHVVAGRSRSRKGDADLRLKQAFKPHNAPVTVIAYKHNGKILATGSSDCTVFFFTVGEKYDPIGFIAVPGPVQGLEWSPQSHSKNTLLILCLSGHVVEVQPPDPEAQNPSKTYQLSGLPSRSFRFRSIKSRIKREEEVQRRQAIKETKKKEREEQLRKAKQEGQDPTEEEEEEELPPIYIPDPPNPLYCGFYSQPGQFWLSLGGSDSGFLYHCKFSEHQDEDPAQRQDEPFHFLPIHDADDDPIHSVTFSATRQLMLCGMQSGSIRAYPLQPSDPDLSSMRAYWALSVHDNHYGHLCHIRCSHDDQFVLTAGEDGNIFSFSLLPPEDLQEDMRNQRARVPSPRAGLETEAVAQDINDPAAYSIEASKQMLGLDRRRRDAELRKKKLMELHDKFTKLLNQNQSLPEHVPLQPAELQLDRRFVEEVERETARRVMEARKEPAWEEERHRIGLEKLQTRFRDCLESDTVAVVDIRSDHSVTTYRLLALAEYSLHLQRPGKDGGLGGPGGPAAQERRESRAEPAEDSSNTDEEEVLTPPVVHSGGLKLAARQVEKFRKAEEKAEKVRAKKEKRKKEWAQLHAEKPEENCEDPQRVLAIRDATENMGDFKLKTAKDFRVPGHLRMNAEKKRAELVALEEKIHEEKTEMNRRIMALRDTKVGLVSRLRSQARQLRRVQRRLGVHLRRPPPALPAMLPEETPERKLRYSRATLERYRALREKRGHTNGQEEEEEGELTLLEQLEKERAEEIREEEELRLLYEQDHLLEEMDALARQFDAELLLLRHQKRSLDIQMKLGDPHHVTLFQERLLLKGFEKREDSLQETLNQRMAEENHITSKLEECNEQLELKRRDVAKLQERERALAAAFQASLGENNKFADFLTKVFKKKIKRKKETPRKEGQGKLQEEEEGSDDDSDEEEDWDDDEDDSGTENEGAPLDDSVCPPNCDPALFEKTVQLRERRLDLEDLLAEEKKCADTLKKECDSLVKKKKVVQSSRQAAEGDLESINREKQQKLNELDAVVPLQLHQIEFTADGSVPPSLAPALVLNRTALVGLEERIKELQVEKSQHRQHYHQAPQQNVQLAQDRREMEAKIQGQSPFTQGPARAQSGPSQGTAREHPGHSQGTVRAQSGHSQGTPRAQPGHMLEERCNQMMMERFGRKVDLEAFQTRGAGDSRSRTLEELKQESLFQEAAYAEDIKQWDLKVTDAHQLLMEATRRHTERLVSMNSLFCQKKELEDKLNSRQRKMGNQFQGHGMQREKEEICRLQEVVETQFQQAEAFRREISILFHKGGQVLPPSQALLPPLPQHLRPANKLGRRFKMDKAQPSTSSQGAN